MAATAAERVAVTRRLAEFAAGLAYEDLPAEVVERAVTYFADALAIMVGAAGLDSTESMVDALDIAGLAAGTTGVPGRKETYSAYGAALLAGAAAHSLDFDDTHAAAQLHPGAPVIAAALVAAQVKGASSRDFLTGLVAGYEVMCRVSYGLIPLSHSDRGWHLTATTGVFGAAAAAGRLLGLDADGLEAAFGTALSQTAGSGQFLVNGAWTKRFHVGHAAAGGFLAAAHAAAGYTGAAQAFEGDSGFFALYSPAPAPEKALEGLGTTWETLGVAIKPYPCCRAIHAPLDALFTILAKDSFTSDEVESIRVGMPRKCVDITGQPQERKRDPRNIVDCQFSVHLCVAMGIVQRGVTFAGYESALASDAVRDLMQRIEAYVDERAELQYPTTFPGHLIVTLKDGRVLDEYAEVPLGEPTNMLTAAAMRAKFTGLTSPVLGEGAANVLFDAITTMAATDVPVGELVGASQ